MKFVTKLSVLLLLSLSASLSSVAGTATLTGHFRGPTNRQFNGYMKLQLPFAGAVDTTCDSGGACMILPTTVQVGITNGVLDTGTRLSRNGDISPAGTYYRAAIYNSDGALVSASNFVIPIAVNSFDVGAALLTSVITNNVSYISPAGTNTNNVYTGTNQFNVVPTDSGGLSFTRTIGAATAATAGTAIAPGVSQSYSMTITGATTTDVARCSLNAALPATWQTGIQVSIPIVTSNTVSFWLSNPTAGSLTPVAATVRCNVTR